MNSIDIFPWNENFNTGITLIDEQHKMLVQLLNQLASHVAFQADIPTLSAIFDQLADYAVYHFQAEEMIWHEYLSEDPMEAKHKLVHNGFIQAVQNLKEETTIRRLVRACRFFLIVYDFGWMPSWFGSFTLFQVIRCNDSSHVVFSLF